MKLGSFSTNRNRTWLSNKCINLGRINSFFVVFITTNSVRAIGSTVFQNSRSFASGAYTHTTSRVFCACVVSNSRFCSLHITPSPHTYAQLSGPA